MKKKLFEFSVVLKVSYRMSIWFTFIWSTQHTT